MSRTDVKNSNQVSGLDTVANKSIKITFTDRRLWLLGILVLLVAAAAQFIGPLAIPLGFATITLLPMIWGLITGTIISGQSWWKFPVDIQQAATVIMGFGVLFLGARLSFTIGPNLPLIFQAGPALLLQEIGHLFGTIALALPLAVLLKMGPATIGATFSIDREGSFAMVSEKYGSDSHQYRGVLSMYVFGTVFGAVIVSLTASLAINMGIFDPLALAMGSGVGSGSMMAAAAAVVVTGFPGMEEQVLALAATSNMITGVLGLYVGVWLALPLADKLYRVMSGNKDVVISDAKVSSPAPTGVPNTAATKVISASVIAGPKVSVPLWISLVIFGIISIIVSIIASRSFSLELIIAHMLIVAVVLVSMGLNVLVRKKVPAIIFLMTIGILISAPFSPISEWVLEASAASDFLAIITVLLTVAGFTLGKDLPMLRQIGWKIIPVGTVAIVASFLLSAIVAEFALGFWGS